MSSPNALPHKDAPHPMGIYVGGERICESDKAITTVLLHCLFKNSHITNTCLY